LEFYGVNNEKLELIKRAYPNVKFVARGNNLKAYGEPDKLQAIQSLIDSILGEIRKYGAVDKMRVKELLAASPGEYPERTVDTKEEDEVLVRGPNGVVIKPKTPGQRHIIDAVRQNDVVFAIGPAGTGKTYNAVAIAVQALKARRVKKIILVRPAVEAGEQLGFLPGDLKDKIDPYLRPLYDGLQDMIQPEKLRNYLEKGIIEIVPLAYMRGRTLNQAFIILDEAQNATAGQLKMFLTRLGRDSKIIVTGDITQIDLPRKQDSGLIHGAKILKNIEGVSFVYLDEQDVVRHPLVTKILAAYEAAEQ
jgi:phosphate starvation-inducible PhoH-like protein